MIPCMLCFVACCQTIQPESQHDLIGAGRVIAAMRSVGKEVPPPPSDLSKFQTSLMTYTATSQKMSVLAAADGWLKLVAAWEKARNEPGLSQISSAVEFDQSPIALVYALPRPEVWPTIFAALIKRPDDNQAKLLTILFQQLLGRDQEVYAACERLRKSLRPGEDPEFDFGGEGFSRVQLPIALRSRDPAMIGKVLERLSLGWGGFFFDGLPDLVSALGPEKSEIILRKIFETTSRPLDSFNGEQTKKLAKSILLSDLDKAKSPQWSLAERPEDTDLVLRLVNKFGVGSLKEGSRGSAEEIYAAALLDSGKIDEAASFLSKGELSAGYFVLFYPRPEQARPLFERMSALLEKHPFTGVWQAYFALARNAGAEAEALKRAEQVLSSPDLGPKTKRTLLSERAKVAEAAGDVDTAVKSLIEASATEIEDSGGDTVLGMLLSLAAATGRKDVTDASIQANAVGYERSYQNESISSLLLSQGRLADAQRLVLQTATQSGRFRQGGPTEDTAVQLAEIYYLANRPKDVVELLDLFPSWEADDLLQVLTLRRRGYARASFWGRSLGFISAWAFAETGKKELAIRTLHDLLAFDQTDDEAFELLNQLEGEAALSFYEDLVKIDPFAPRPVTWRADLLRRLGRLEEAEKVGREAISMDPTDGNASTGRRLRSYAILAQILRARSKNEEADLCERIVKAVRIAEKGDQYREAGLIPQAIQAYRESSSTFADAYCVEARLAVSLAAEGKNEEALAHYRRAYELMPDQFGRIESLCFGCESTFVGETLQNLALSVFQGLAKEQPNKPQVHYLLGKLYSQVGDSKAAVAAFRRAVELDPRYYNSWKELGELARLGAAPPDLAQEAAIAMVQLDPLRLHGGWRLDGTMADYGRLWNVLQGAYNRLPKPPKGPLYPLRRRAKVQDFGMGASLAGLRQQSPVWQRLMRYGPGGALSYDEGIAAICRLRHPSD